MIEDKMKLREKAFVNGGLLGSGLSLTFSSIFIFLFYLYISNIINTFFNKYSDPDLVVSVVVLRDCFVHIQSVIIINILILLIFAIPLLVVGCMKEYYQRKEIKISTIEVD